MDRAGRGREAGPSGRLEAGLHAMGEAAAAAALPQMRIIPLVASGSGVGFLHSMSATLQRSHAYIVRSRDEACPMGALALMGEGLCASLWDKLFSKPLSFKQRFQHTQAAGGWKQLLGRQEYEYRLQRGPAGDQGVHDELRCREFVQQVFQAAHDAGCKAVVDMASAVGARKPHVLAAMALSAQPHCVLTVSCYEPGVAPSSPACTECVDSGLVTLLVTPGKHALQVLSRSGQWQDADVGPAHVAVLPGYTAEFITRGAVRAAQYRVLPLRASQVSGVIPAEAGALVLRMSLRCGPEVVLDPLAVMGPQQPLSVSQLLAQFRGEWPGVEDAQDSALGAAAAAGGNQQQQQRQQPQAEAQARLRGGGAAHVDLDRARDSLVARVAAGLAERQRQQEAQQQRRQLPAVTGMKRTRGEDSEEGDEDDGDGEEGEGREAAREQRGRQEAESEEERSAQMHLKQEHLQHTAAGGEADSGKGEEDDSIVSMVRSHQCRVLRPKQEQLVARAGGTSLDMVHGTISSSTDGKLHELNFQLHRFKPFGSVLKLFVDTFELEAKDVTFRFRGMRISHDQTPADHGMAGEEVHIVAHVEPRAHAQEEVGGGGHGLSQPHSSRSVMMMLVVRDSAGRQVKYEVSQNIRLEEVHTHYCEARRLDARYIALNWHDAAVDLTHTPAKLGLVGGDVLHAVARVMNLTVRSLTGHNVQFKVPSTMLMSRVHSAYCDKRGLDPRAVHFLHRASRLTLQETPADLGLSDGDIVDALLEQYGGGSGDRHRTTTQAAHQPQPYQHHMVPSQPAPQPAATASQAGWLQLVARDRLGAEFKFLMRRNTPFERLFTAYAQRPGAADDGSTCRFVFDGKALLANSTPDEWDMEDGDVIDVEVAVKQEAGAGGGGTQAGYMTAAQVAKAALLSGPAGAAKQRHRAVPSAQASAVVPRLAQPPSIKREAMPLQPWPSSQPKPSEPPSTQPHQGASQPHTLSQLPLMELLVCDMAGKLTFKVKPTIPFSKIYYVYCQKRGIADARAVAFTWGAAEIEPTDTPTTHGMHDGAEVQAQLLYVIVTFQWQGKEEAFKAKAHTPFAHILEAFCSSTGMSQSTLQVKYNGRAVRMEHTPHCFGVQPGGGMAVTVAVQPSRR